MSAPNVASGSDSYVAEDVLAVIPVFDDWEALGLLLNRLDEVVRSAPFGLRVLIVDDGSRSPMPDEIRHRRYGAIAEVSQLFLRRNLGHQRAIAIALAYVHDNDPCGAVVVMDGDGEDAPEDVAKLVARMRELGDSAVVFAERARRSESWLFQLCYRVYQVLHLALTGIRVRVGNFSAIPRSLLGRVVVVSELWNHYAAAVFKSRLPFETVPTQRAPRLSGHSRMNFVSLVIHGLSALSVHGEVIGVRLVVATLLAILLVTGMLVGLLGAGLSTEAEFPAWTMVLAGITVVLLSQAVVLAIVFVFVILQARINANFLPLRDYSYFVGRAEGVFPPAEAAEPDVP
jgi:hypothetical protein